MMRWNYRVVLEEDYYTLREVYYDNDDSILACAEQPIELGGESLEELTTLLKEVQVALNEPILTAAELPSQPSAQPSVKRGTSLEDVRRELGLDSVEIGKSEA
jgi:hypothetical protein